MANGLSRSSAAFLPAVSSTGVTRSTSDGSPVRDAPRATLDGQLARGCWAFRPRWRRDVRGGKSSDALGRPVAVGRGQALGRRIGDRGLEAARVDVGIELTESRDFDLGRTRRRIGREAQREKPKKR